MNLKRVASVLLEFFLPKTRGEHEIETLTTASLSAKIHARELWGNPYVIALFDYRDKTIKSMIWSLKYRGNEKATLLFAYILLDYFIEEISDARMYRGSKRPLILGIPLSGKRLKERGFNQIELVLNKLRGLDKNQVFSFPPYILLRIKNTPSQTRLQSRVQRQKNLAGAFQVKDRNTIEGRDVILLDDVITTGSTILEARKTLLGAGAKSVFCIGLAH